MRPPAPRSVPKNGRLLGRAWVVALAGSVALVALVGRANAPPGWYQIQSGTVLDTKTKLTWQQAADAGPYDMQHAATYCTGLALNDGGWRVPSVKELYTIVDETRGNPAIDPSAFPMVPPAGEFWSSSVVAGPSGAAWAVRFDIGETEIEMLDAGLSIRCVR